MKNLYSQAQKVQRLLKRLDIPFGFIGGLSNTVHGDPRATLDIDVLIIVPEERIKSFIEKLQSEVILRSGDPVEFAYQTKVIPIELSDGLRVDLLLVSLDYEKEILDRAVDMAVDDDLILKVCTPEDLIIMKMISTRPRDREDVKGIIARQVGRLDLEYISGWLKKFEKMLDRSDLLSDLKVLMKP